MKRLLLALFLVLSLGLYSFGYADELVAPFTKVKQITETRGKEVEPGVKALSFVVEDKTITFIAANNGNVGIVVEDGTVGLLIAYDAETKVYYAVSMTPTATFGPGKLSEADATKWAFDIFRLLVEKGLI